MQIGFSGSQSNMSNASLRAGIDTASAPDGVKRLAGNLIESLLCFILPGSTLLFLADAPHRWESALVWTLPVWLCVIADLYSPEDRRGTGRQEPARWLDARLYVLFALQWVNLILLLEAVSRLHWESWADVAVGGTNLIAMRILMGTSSCCSAIAVAHELIHRRPRHLRWMGRLLLWTVCYDHFALEHGRGHHRLASTLDDPATARFGERFEEFFRRSLKGQWANAWRHESQRLRGLPPLARLIRHRVLLGLCAESVLLAAILSLYGPLPLLMFLYQAWVAVRMLEAVNYVQHWGLVRSGPAFQASDAWSTGSWFTLHSFVGLARHADHHLLAGKPCHQLRHLSESPRLPGGYFVDVIFVRLFNDRYMKKAEDELKAKRLGPFRSESH